MTKKVSVDMGNEYNPDWRIFGNVIDTQGDTLLCEFESANYDYKNSEYIAELELRIAHLLSTGWFPLENEGVAGIDFDLIPADRFLKEVKEYCFIDDDGHGIPVIKATGDRLLYQNRSIYPSEIIKKKKLDYDFVAWYNR